MTLLLAVRKPSASLRVSRRNDVFHVNIKVSGSEHEALPSHLAFVPQLWGLCAGYGKGDGSVRKTESPL